MNPDPWYLLGLASAVAATYVACVWWWRRHP